jgi:hypothetical protein
MLTNRSIAPTLLLLLAALALPASSASAQIPVPSGPVTFCGTQAAPSPDTYTVQVDGGVAQPLTMAASLDARCPAGSTHSFTLPASLFTVGSHTVRVRATNAYGSTDGPTYTVTVGIAPGQFTVTSVLPPQGQ